MSSVFFLSPVHFPSSFERGCSSSASTINQRERGTLRLCLPFPLTCCNIFFLENPEGRPRFILAKLNLGEAACSKIRDETQVLLLFFIVITALRVLEQSQEGGGVGKSDAIRKGRS